MRGPCHGRRAAEGRRSLEKCEHRRSDGTERRLDSGWPCSRCSGRRCCRRERWIRRTDEEGDRHRGAGGPERGEQRRRAGRRAVGRAGGRGDQRQGRRARPEARADAARRRERARRGGEGVQHGDPPAQGRRHHHHGDERGPQRGGAHRRPGQDALHLHVVLRGPGVREVPLRQRLGARAGGAAAHQVHDRREEGQEVVRGRQRLRLRARDDRVPPRRPSRARGAPSSARSTSRSSSRTGRRSSARSARPSRTASSIRRPGAGPTSTS